MELINFFGDNEFDVCFERQNATKNDFAKYEKNVLTV